MPWFFGVLFGLSLRCFGVYDAHVLLEAAPAIAVIVLLFFDLQVLRGLELSHALVAVVAHNQWRE